MYILCPALHVNAMLGDVSMSQIDLLIYFFGQSLLVMLMIVSTPTMMPTTIETLFDHSSKSTHENPTLEAHAVNPATPLLIAAIVLS